MAPVALAFTARHATDTPAATNRDGSTFLFAPPFPSPLYSMRSIVSSASIPSIPSDPAPPRSRAPRPPRLSPRRPPPSSLRPRRSSVRPLDHARPRAPLLEGIIRARSPPLPVPP